MARVNKVAISGAIAIGAALALVVGTGAVAFAEDEFGSRSCSGVRSVSAFAQQQGNGWHHYEVGSQFVNTSAPTNVWTYRQTVAAAQSTAWSVNAPSLRNWGSTCY